MISRDKDYRGKPSSVDWGKLGYAARMRRPGALEVLQDAIMTWFPQQFKKAQTKARWYKKREDQRIARWRRAAELDNTDTFTGRLRRQNAKRKPQEWFVSFNWRIARRRFEPRRILKQRGSPRKAGGVRQKRVTLTNPRQVPFSVMANEEFRYASKDPLFHSVAVWGTQGGLNIGNVR